MISTAESKIKHYALMVSEALEARREAWPQSALFDPVHYLIDLGGKRIRPALVLAACAAEKGDPKEALPAALAVELFHNFTLMHDDIMDKAPLRRGKATVHEKWDPNTAILSGDAMFVQAYEELAEMNSEHLGALLKLFNRTAMEVCEGQQLDMAFETQDAVEIEEYMEMIRLKTSVLLAASLQMGALIAGADRQRQEVYYAFGIELGLAFQLQDDWLDAFGNPETVGKQSGGDILSDKKTYLYVATQKRGSSEEAKALKGWTGEGHDPHAKVRAVKALFESSGARREVEEQIDLHVAAAMDRLKHLELDPEAGGMLASLVHKAARREA